MRTIRQFAILALLSLALSLTACKGVTKRYLDLPPPQSKKIISEKNVMVPMRDGIKLATDIYRPASDGKFPVILVRIPYDKKTMEMVGQVFAQQGYVCVIQDCRGTFHSEGVIFFPLFKEADDGMDTTEWVAKQPWFSGKMGAWGGSYFGYTQWAMAPDNRYLKAFYPLITTPNMADMMYVGGALQYELAAGWSSAVGHQSGTRRTPTKEYQKLAILNLPLQPPALDLKRLALNIDNPAIFKEMMGVDVPSPLNPKKIPANLVKTLNTKVVEAFNYPKLILAQQAWTFGDDYKRVSAPAMSVGGWYDLFIKTQLADFNKLITVGRGDAKKSKLVIGPWGHGTAKNFLTKGDESVSMKGMVREFARIQWFDYWLKGKQNGVLDGPPIRIYVMGRNEWRNENEWPLARTKYVKYYIHSKGKARSATGDGSLDANAPTDAEPTDLFDYDPKNPVPTTGGSNLLESVGPAHQGKVESRPDVTVYTSAALDDDTEVTGPITATLYAASSAVDTDFTVKLVDVFPNGDAVNIQDGIVRARFRDSLTEPSLIAPGKMYKYTMDLWATSYVFLKGHRIRVDISSSNFPRFEANSNMGGQGGEFASIIAHQTIYHDAEHPTFIILPVIPNKK